MDLLTNKGAFSSSSTQNYKYDVFLSFRGEDTCLDFMSFLNGFLNLKGINTFIDYELPRGEEILLNFLNPLKVQGVS